VLRVIGLSDEPGTLRIGATADVWALSDDRGRFILRDNEKTEIVAERLLQPLFCLRAGMRYDADSVLPRGRLRRDFRAARCDERAGVSLKKKGAPTPPVRECAAPIEQLELISPEKFQFSTPNWGRAVVIPSFLAPIHGDERTDFDRAPANTACHQRIWFMARMTTMTNSACRRVPVFWKTDLRRPRTAVINMDERMTFSPDSA
jgi:hypothetical protein